MYQAKVLADSLNPYNNVRLTTMQITYPRFVHSEFMTHRMFSRNSASSRAIPIKTMILNVLDDPVLPVWWGKNQAGMQAKEELSKDEQQTAAILWLEGRNRAVTSVESLSRFGLHKQIANRLLEPWMWITVICSATEWDNFFKLRCHPDAQPEIQKIAYMMRDLYEANTPVLATYHLPLQQEEELTISNYNMEDWKKICTGRCARVSYLTHEGKRDPQADIDLCARLQESGHWSPFEHIATAKQFPDSYYSGNFRGWLQYRKEVEV